MAKFPGRGKEDDPKNRRARFLSFLRQETPRAAAEESSTPPPNGAPHEPAEEPLDDIPVASAAEAALPYVADDDIPMAVAAAAMEDDIPQAVEAIPAAVEEDDIPAAVEAILASGEIPAGPVAEIPAPDRLPPGALIADEEISAQPRRRDERKRPIWTQEDETEAGERRPAELFPLRGRRGDEPDEDAWEAARSARETQQAAAREAAMTVRDDNELKARGAHVEPPMEAGAPPVVEEAPEPMLEEAVEEAPPVIEEAAPVIEEAPPENASRETEPLVRVEVEAVPVVPPTPEAPVSPRTRESVMAVAASSPPSSDKIPALRRQGVAVDVPAVAGVSSENDVVIHQVTISGEIVPRKEITFTMRYRNHTRHTFRNITLRCDMPAHTAYMPESTVINGVPVPDERGTSSIAMGRGLPLGDLAPRQEGEVSFTCILNPGLRDGTLIQHTVHLLQETRSIATHTCFTRARGEPVFADPDTCRLTASPEKVVAPGDFVDYTFAVRNVGTAPATGITLFAVPPEHTVYVPNSTRWEGRMLADVENGSALFAAAGLYLGTLAPGEAHGASYRVRVKRPLDSATHFACQGEVRSHEAEPVAIAPVAHEVLAAPAFVEQRKAGRGGVDRNTVNIFRNGEEVRDTQPGELLTFTIALANSGDMHAYHSRLWSQVPAHVEYVRGSMRRDGQNVPDQADGANPLFTDEGLPLGLLEAASFEEEPPLHEVTFQGRVAWPLPNGTEIRITAAVAAQDLARRDLTPVRALVHAAPRFDPADTGLFVDPVGRVRPGELLTFSVRYKNSGDAAASQVVLRAGLPAEAPYLASSTRCDGRTLPDEDGASVLFGESGLNIGAVEAGAAGEVTFQAQVRTPLDRGTMIRARAALTCAELGPVAFPPVSLEVLSAPDFAAEKVNRLEVSPAEVIRPGEVLHYTLHFKNAGDANATGVVLRARVPDHTTPVEGTLTLDGHPVADIQGTPALFAAEGLRLGEVPAGKSGRVTYSAVVNRPLENATQIYHSVGIASDQARPVETKAVLVMVTSAPDFTSAERNRLDVFPKGDVAPGQKLTYTLDYRNSGDADATGVFIKARLPAHTTYLPESTRVNGQVVADHRSASALFSPRGLSIGTVPVDLGGKITFEVRVNSPLDNGQMLECQAQLGCAEVAGAVATNKVENRVASSPDFNSEDVNYLTASPSGEIQPDEVITYVLRYKNTGNARARGVSLRSEIGAHVRYRPGSTLFNGRNVADADSASPLFTPAGMPVGTVDADEAGEVTFQVVVDSPLDNGVTLWSQGFLISEALGQISTSRVTHAVMSLPSFADRAKTRVEVSPSGAVRPGERVSYTLHFHNSGKAHAQNVAVRAMVPEHTVLVPDSVRVNGQPLNADDVEALFAEHGKSIGRVAAGEGGTIAWQVDLKKPLVNGMTISCHAVLTNSATAPAQTAAAQSPVLSHVDFSAAAGNAVASDVGVAAPDDTVLYTVRYFNGGDANASGVTLTVQLLQPDLAYVPHMTTLNGLPIAEQGPVGLLLTAHGLPIGDVPAGGGGVATFTVRVGRRAADGAKLGVRSEIRSDQGAPIALEAPPLLVSAPPQFSDAAYNNLEVYPVGKVACDELLTYTINYGNRGNAVAPDMRLRAQLPEHTGYVAGTTFLNGEPVPDSGSASPLFTREGLFVGQVEPQAYGNAVFQVRVASDLPNGTQIACTAIIDCGEKYTFNTNATRNSVSSTPDFGGAEGAHLEVTPVGDVSPHDTLTYVFNYRNRGNATATHVALRGKLPENTRYLARSTKLNGLPVQDMAGTSPLFTERGLVIPEVPAGAAGRVSIRVQVESPLPSGTEVTAQVTLSSQQTAPVTSNRCVTTVLSYPDFSTAEATFMQVFPHGAVAPGQVLTFLLYYQNSGSTHADELHVRSHLPPYTVYVAGSTRANALAVADAPGAPTAGSSGLGSPLFAGDGLILPRVEAGVSGNVSFQVKVDEGASDGVTIQGRADLATVPATAPASVLAPAVTVSKNARLIAPAATPVAVAVPTPVVAASSIAGNTPAVEAPAPIVEVPVPVVAAPPPVLETPPPVVEEAAPPDEGIAGNTPPAEEATASSEEIAEYNARLRALPLEKFVPPATPAETPPSAESRPPGRLSLDIDRLRRFREERARGLAEGEIAPENESGGPTVEMPAPIVAPAEAAVSETAPEPEAVEAALPEVAPAPEVEAAIPEAAPAPEVEAAIPEAAPAPEAEAAIPEAAPAPEAEAEEEEALGAEPLLHSDELGEAATEGELPLSVYLTITRDQVEALRRLQQSNTGLLAHFEASAHLMARSFYGTYRTEDARALNTLMGSLSRAIAEYHKSHRGILARLTAEMEGGTPPDLAAVSDSAHDETLERVDGFVGRFYSLQEEMALGFNAPRHDPGKKSFIVGAHMPRVEYNLVRRLTEESRGYAGFLRHLIFVQTLMGNATAARNDQVAEDLDNLLREYTAASKSVLNRQLVNARSQKKIDLTRPNRQLDRCLQALVEFLAGQLE